MTPTTTTNATLIIDETIELEFGSLLIAEAEDGSYEPVGMVSTIEEARTLAAENLHQRRSDLTKGESPMCPDRYVIWQRGRKGYSLLQAIEV